MRVACLVSGGKDSMLALHKASESHEVVCLVSIFSKNPDSYMFHTANISMTDAIAQCLEIPIFKIWVSGEEEREVNELGDQLSALGIDGIVIGGIRSEYQRKRFQKVADRLGIKMIAPLWNMDEIKIMEEVSRKFNAIIVKVSAMGLDESFLGKRIDGELVERLLKVKERYVINIAGEGGEFETLVLDAPLYRRSIEPVEWRIKRDSLTSQLEICGFRFTEKQNLSSEKSASKF